jgi:hypothetical protein
VLPRGTQAKYLKGHAWNSARLINSADFAPADLERFYSFIRLADNAQCWAWTGPREKSGYGRIQLGRRRLKAHRVMWALGHGILPGIVEVLHHCDTTGLGVSCVRPDHLMAGDHTLNARDAASKGRLARKLRPGNILEMRELHAAGRSMKSLAAQFGVARYAVEMIVTGRGWYHLIGDWVPAPTWRVSPTCRRGHAYDGEYTSPAGVWCRTCAICIRLNQDIQTARRRAARKAEAA